MSHLCLTHLDGIASAIRIFHKLIEKLKFSKKQTNVI